MDLAGGQPEMWTDRWRLGRVILGRRQLCRDPVVVLQQAAESFATLNRTDGLWRAVDQAVIEPLVVPLFVIVTKILGTGTSK